MHTWFHCFYAFAGD